MVELILPWPPSVNHYWVHARGRAFISKAGRAFRDAVIWECKAKRVKRQTGRLGVFVQVRAPDRRRRDLDNLNKAALDALQHAGVYDDDSQIDALTIHRGPLLEGGALYIRVQEIPG